MFPRSKEEFVSLSQKANLIPVYEEYSAALETPLSAFLKLHQNTHAFLLESVEGGVHIGRYSFVGVEPSILFKAEGGKVSVTEKGEIREYITPDPLMELEKIFKRYKPLEVEDLPIFSGGAVGYLGYDMIRCWEKKLKKKTEDTGYPDCFFVFAETIIAFDHVKQTMKIVINTPVGKNPADDYERALEKIDAVIDTLTTSVPRLPKQEKTLPAAENLKYEVCSSAEEFQEKVKKAKEYIQAGEISQVVLSQKIEFSLNASTIDIYCSLRSLNPSPYMFYLSFGDIQLIGSSPEVMIKVEGGTAETRPIAGTRPRGMTCEEDEFLAGELLADEKERSEHLMLLDLGQEDLGKVSEYGSVKVDDFMSIENYSHVMHIVSKISGKLKKEYSAFDVMRACFPAGTVSGAPKIRAMEIIDELEKKNRGPYSGAVGYFGYSGNMDTCIAIRTIITKGDSGFIQAGAGIVADSNPEREHAEVWNKARALLKALEMAERGKSFAAGSR